MKPTSIKGLGANQRAVLETLSDGDWHTTSELGVCCSGDAGHARVAVYALARRGFVIEDRRDKCLLSFRLLPYPDKPWLPIAFIPDFYRLTWANEFTEAEAREIIEDHMAVIERRKARAA